MKINIEIDCTPEEARRFFGLPDVEPVQRRVMEALEKRLTEAVQNADSAALFDQWMPLTLKGIEQWQNFWTRFAAAATGRTMESPVTGQAGGTTGGTGPTTPGGQGKPKR